MKEENSKRVKRIFVIALIILCIIAIFFLLSYLKFKKGQKTQNCMEFNEKCICFGILTEETTQFVADNYSEEYTIYSCKGPDYCWDINEKVCG